MYSNRSKGERLGGGMGVCRIWRMIMAARERASREVHVEAEGEKRSVKMARAHYKIRYWLCILLFCPSAYSGLHAIVQR